MVHFRDSEEIQNKVSYQEVRIEDLRQKLSDKVSECESYIQISEHRLSQYNDLMQKKKELEN